MKLNWGEIVGAPLTPIFQLLKIKCFTCKENVSKLYN